MRIFSQTALEYNDQILNINIITPYENIKYSLLDALNVTKNEIYLIDNYDFKEIDTYHPNEKKVLLNGWTQEQHFELETALRKYKNIKFDNAKEKWTLISEDVNGKTMSDCVRRFKFVKESLKKAIDREEKIEPLSVFLDFIRFHNIESNSKIILLDCLTSIPDATKEFLKKNLDISYMFILYNFDYLLFNYELKAEEIYNRLYIIVTEIQSIDPYYKDFSPVKNNILFGSNDLKFCFSLKTFAKQYVDKLKISEEDLIPKLWGDNFFNKKWEVIKSENSKRSFCNFVIIPIIRLSNTIKDKNINKISKMLDVINIKYDKEILENINYMDVLNEWLHIKKELIEFYFV